MHIKPSFWLAVFHGKFRIMCVLLISGPNGEEFAWYQCTVSILSLPVYTVQTKTSYILFIFSTKRK